MKDGLFVAMGLNFRTAPVDLREKCHVRGEDVPGLLAELRGLEHVLGVMVLSTCNRTEIAARVADPAAHKSLTDTLVRRRGIDAAQFEHHVYHHFGKEAVRHVFRVASSLDSMVVGEPQILGQFKEAYQHARQAGTLCHMLNRLAEKALHVAKRVRSETGIADGAVSAGYAAVGLARRIFQNLSQQRVVVVGAGEMAVSMLEHLAAQSVRELVIVNRNHEAALELAARFNGSAMPFGLLHDVLGQADIVLASTSHPGHLLSKEDVQRMLHARKGRPLFLIDISIPRNIDPAVNELEGAFLYNIDHLREVVEENRQWRQKEAALAETLVDGETEAFSTFMEKAHVEPLIRAIREKAEAARQEELERTLRRLASLSEEDRRALELMSDSMVKRILNDPILALKEAAQNGGGRDLAEALERLFKL